MKSTGLALKNLRKQKGLTLQQVSQETGVSVSFLSDVERGQSNPSLDTLHTLSSFYGVEIELQPNDASQALDDLHYVIEKLRCNKPEERGELARRHAVAITELEKNAAYIQVYIVEASFEN